MKFSFSRVFLVCLVLSADSIFVCDGEEVKSDNKFTERTASDDGLGYPNL